MTSFASAATQLARFNVEDDTPPHADFFCIRGNVCHALLPSLSWRRLTLTSFASAATKAGAPGDFDQARLTLTSFASAATIRQAVQQ